MKKTCISILFLVLGILASGQTDIAVCFNSVGSGINFTIDYSKTIKSKNELGLGLRININRIKHPDDQMHVFLNRLYATEFLQYFGIRMFYHKMIFHRLECIKPFLFYDLQSSWSTTRNYIYSPCSLDTNGNVLYKNITVYYGPFFWIEQNIGIGFKARIFKSFYLTQSIGAGVLFIIGEDKILPITYDKFSWEFGYLLSVGIVYRIKE
ncbi:MAG: hypothetical protein V1733_03960 [bacterium]